METWSGVFGQIWHKYLILVQGMANLEEWLLFGRAAVPWGPDRLLAGCQQIGLSCNEVACGHDRGPFAGPRAGGLNPYDV